MVYSCLECKYETNHKNKYERHLTTKKHIDTSIVEDDRYKALDEKYKALDEKYKALEEKYKASEDKFLTLRKRLFEFGSEKDEKVRIFLTETPHVKSICPFKDINKI